MFRVLCAGHLIGEADLRFADSAMSVTLGQFYPSPAYEAVRPVFLLFTQSLGATAGAADGATLARYYEQRGALQ